MHTFSEGKGILDFMVYIKEICVALPPLVFYTEFI